MVYIGASSLLAISETLLKHGEYRVWIDSSLTAKLIEEFLRICSVPKHVRYVFRVRIRGEHFKRNVDPIAVELLR